MQRRGYAFQNIVLPLAVNLTAAALAAAIGLLVSRQFDVDASVALVVALLTLGLLTAFTRRAIRRRYITLKVVTEPSASRCGDHFIRLARLAFSELKDEAHALATLSEVAEIRRYPNRRFVEDLIALGADHAPAAARRRYLELLPDAKRSGRLEVRRTLDTFVRDLPSDTQIVLYGYSSTICESLARCGDSLEPAIFLVEDLQYGEGSLGEHFEAQAELEAGGLCPILISFDQIGALASSAHHFIKSAGGQTVALPEGRRLVTLLGCEAVGVDGEVLIPSRVRGKPSETAKFVAIFHSAAEQLEVPARIVVVSESYKTHARFERDDARSHAPTKPARWRWLAALIGLSAVPRGAKIELVRLAQDHVDVIIDDSGLHPGPTPDMRPSLAEWHQKTVGRILGRGTENPLRSATVVLFDLNGVLMDDEPAHFSAFVDMTHSMGSTLRWEEYLRYCSGRTDREGIEAVLSGKGLSGDVELLLALKRDAYERHRGTLSDHAVRGATQLASRLHAAGARCYLVTSADETTARAFVNGCGLTDVFPAGRSFCEIDGGRRVDVYSSIVEQSGGPRSCVLIDDSPSNILAAKGLGIATVGVASSHPRGNLNADLVIDDPEELTSLAPAEALRA